MINSKTSRQPHVTLDGKQLAAELQTRLTGGEPVALWAERGDRVLVHAAETAAEVHAHGIVVTVPLETAETGRAPVRVALALSSGDEEPDCVMATEEDAEGEPLLVGRWGAALQDAIYNALLGLLEEAAQRAGGKPLGFRVHGRNVALFTLVPREKP